MNSGSNHLFPFTGFSPATFLSPVSASASHSSVAALQKPRRKRSKLIKSPTDRLLAPSSSAAAAGIAKPKYAKKPDQTAPKITRPCSECGKQFWSWKALFGHMRCHPERQWRGINPPPNLRRSESTAAATDEDREIAACLIMLANGPSPNAIDRIEAAVTETVREIQEAETAATVGRFGPPSCRFECSSCKKVFGSHQALGGHRASHKNVKGCFAVGGGGGTAAESQCSVCVKAFSRLGYLDLNLPPPMEDIEESSSSYSSEIGLDLRLGLN